MFTSKSRRPKSGLELAIDELHLQMQTVMGDTEEFDRLTDQLVKLYKLREHDSRPSVSPDALLLSVTNLLGIVIIVSHEKTHVVTSKALGFLAKLR